MVISRRSSTSSILISLFFAALCYLYLGDTQEAEDIASDIFASVWENRKKLEIRLTFKAYLFQAAKTGV